MTRDEELDDLVDSLGNASDALRTLKGQRAISGEDLKLVRAARTFQKKWQAIARRTVLALRRRHY